MRKDNPGSFNRKEHPFSFMYPLCAKIYSLFVRLRKEDLLVKKSAMERLHVNEDTDTAIRLEAYKTISYMLAVVGIAVIMAAMLALNDVPAVNEGKIARKEAGEGAEQYDLIVKDGSASEEVTVNVSEKKYNGDELEQYFEAAFERLEKTLLAGNLSAENVSEDLNFSGEIEGTPIKVIWEEIDRDYIYSTGKIRREAVTEPVIVYLTARLEYFDEVRIYTFPLRLVPLEVKAEETFAEKLNEALKAEDMASAESKWFNLPKKVDGKELDWEEKRKPQWLWVLLLGVAAAVAVIPAVRSETDGREKKLEEEMIRDYPDIVSKFVLLVNAGMTCKGAWEKICMDYKAGGVRRYAYEEMVRSARELDFGGSEGAVYEEFGRRCNVAAYRKFGTLLANNLRRGSRDLTALLEHEAQEAFAGRVENVKRRAAEAATKLLLPMFGMLCLVFAIIIVPAFSVFGG